MLSLRAKITHRVTRSIAWRVEEQVVALRDQVGDLERTTRELADRNTDLDKRLGELERWVGDVARESSWSANELARLAPQAAAFEARLEQQARPTVLTGDLADLPEARLLVDVIREEHARVRARLSLVSAYEERLRRLELAQRSAQAAG